MRKVTVFDIVAVVLVGIGCFIYFFTDKSTANAIQISQLANQASFYLLLGIFVKLLDSMK